jgi:hypothetical protein
LVIPKLGTPPVIVNEPPAAKSHVSGNGPVVDEVSPPVLKLICESLSSSYLPESGRQVPAVSFETHAIGTFVIWKVCPKPLLKENDPPVPPPKSIPSAQATEAPLRNMQPRKTRTPMVSLLMV